MVVEWILAGFAASGTRIERVEAVDVIYLEFFQQIGWLGARVSILRIFAI